MNCLLNNERKILLELICNEQIHMIVKDSSKYNSEFYKELEALKIKIKDMEVDIAKAPECYGEYNEKDNICKGCMFKEKCK